MQFTSFDGKKICLYVWDDVASPCGVVQIVHGMTEHAARYEAFAKFLNAHGYIVVADDHRGHGGSDPETLGWYKGDMFADNGRDERASKEHFREKYAGLP